MEFPFELIENSFPFEFLLGVKIVQQCFVPNKPLPKRLAVRVGHTKSLRPNWRSFYFNLRCLNFFSPLA